MYIPHLSRVYTNKITHPYTGNEHKTDTQKPRNLPIYPATRYHYAAIIRQTFFSIDTNEKRRRGARARLHQNYLAANTIENTNYRQVGEQRQRGKKRKLWLDKIAKKNPDAVRKTGKSVINRTRRRRRRLYDVSSDVRT